MGIKYDGSRTSVALWVWTKVSRLGRFLRQTKLLLACAAASVMCAPLTAQSATPQFVYTAVPTPPNISAFKLDPATGALTLVAGSPFNERLSPAVLALDPAGKFLFVGNQTTNDVSVFKIDQTTGALTEATNSPFSSGSGISPTYMAVDPTSKFLFVANASATANAAVSEIDVYKIDPVRGTLTPSPNSLNSGTAMQGPPFIHGIYAHPNGKWLYVIGGTFQQFGCDLRQYQIDPTTGDLTVVVAPAPGLPCLNSHSLVGDPQGNFLYLGYGQLVGSIGSAQISPLDGSLTSVSVWSSIGSFQGQFAVSMTVDSTGNFLFTNLGSFKITGGVISPIVVGLTSPPWAADLIGPYVYESGSAGLLGKLINPADGTLMPTPGSPYSPTGFQFMAITGYPPQTAAPAVSFLPASLQLGTPLLGSSFVSPIQLFNTGTADLNIAGVSITGANPGDFSQTNNCPSTLSAGSNCTFSITFTPTIAGTRTAALTISDNAAGSPQSAGLSGVGVTPAPAVALVPASLVFSSTVVGDTSGSQPLTVTNSGSGPLHITSVGFSGANPGDFTQSNNCIGTIAVSASCTINIAFKPQAVGARSASASISDDAASSPQSSGVSGTGRAPFSIAPMGSSGTTVTFTPGQTSQYPAQFTSLPNFTGTVSFSCLGAPVGTNCTVSPQSLQVTSQSNTQMLVNISPTSTAFVAPPVLDPGTQMPGGPISRLLAVFAVSLLFLLLIMRAKVTLVQVRFGHFALATILFAALVISACGGAGKNQIVPPGTQPAPGSYPLTIVASSGNASANLNLTLNVQ